MTHWYTNAVAGYVLTNSASLTTLQGASLPEIKLQRSKVDCKALDCHELKTATVKTLFSCARCHNDEPQGFLKYIEGSVVHILVKGKTLYDITKGARNLVINIYKNGKVTLAEWTFIMSAVIVGVYCALGIYSAYDKMQQDILRAQEGDPQNIEEQENRARVKFKKTVVARSLSGVGAVVGATGGIFLGSSIFGGSRMGSLFGGILGSYVGWNLLPKMLVIIT